MGTGTQARGQNEHVDGRVARGARNRDRIVEAAIALVRGGDQQPTAERIADEAGVGVRSVFRHFEDLDGLFRAISARVEEEIVPLADNSPIEGDLDRRVRELVRRRVRVYEVVAPFRRSARVYRSQSESLRIGHEHLDRWHRAQLKRTLADQLAGARSELLEALDAAASFETWDRLRTDQRLSGDRAAAVMCFALRATLDGANYC